MTVKIKLTNGYEAIVDNDDAERVNVYKWRSHISGNTIYARTDFYYSDFNVTIFLHDMILGYKPNHTIDHKNGNALDCRKSNLRFATNSENNLNRIGWSHLFENYKGIYYADKNKKKVIARLRINGKLHTSPTTNNIHIAARYYNLLVQKHCPEFGKLNTIKKPCMDRHKY